jgi:hypothetical protein
MSRKLFGTGAHGGIVGDFQCGLVASQCDPRRCDEVVVPRTPRAVTQVQFSNHLPQMRDIDDVTWPAFMPKPVRSLFDRSPEMTTVFERHSYTLAVGGFEDALLTLRIVGFTMTFGKVQTNIPETNQLHPELIEQTFGDNAGTLIGIVRSTPDQRKSWAYIISIDGRLATLRRQQFRASGSLPEVREIQLQVARVDRYLLRLTTPRDVGGLQSELAIALCFDIDVQKGSITYAAQVPIQKKLNSGPNRPEAERRQIIANAAGSAAIPAFRDDVRSRKIAIATGQGSVHSASYDLNSWSLGEFPAEGVAFTHIQTGANRLRFPAITEMFFSIPGGENGKPCCHPNKQHEIPA